MKVNRVALLECLKSVKPGLSNKLILEQSTSFVFQEGQVITFNDEIAVHAPMVDGWEFTGAVPAKELLAILERFKGEEVEITSPTDKELLLKSGKSRSGIKLESTISLPTGELKIPTEWKKLPEDFRTGISCCIPSASRSLQQPILTTLHVTGEFVESTDTNRLSRFWWGENSELGDGFLLPVETAVSLARFDMDSFWEEDGWAHFKNKSDAVFSCRTVSGDYMDLGPFLDIEEVGVLEFPEGLNDMLNRAGVFLSGAETENTVEVSIDTKGILLVRGEGEYGWYEESCRATWKGKEGVKFSIHPAHLAAILNNSKSASISESRIKFVTEQFTHVVAMEVA